MSLSICFTYSLFPFAKNAMRIIYKSSFILLLVLQFIVTSCSSVNTGIESDFQKVILQAQRKVYPALVYIKVTRNDLTEGKKQSATVSGSGVIISANGEVLTNHHVITKATDIRCLLNDGQHFHAKLIASDKDLDLALLQLQLPENHPPLPFAKLHENTAKEGDFVMALGAPLGLTRSVTLGIISCANRIIDGVDHQYNTWYQTDASLFPGNSGGPLVNTDGHVIGLNSMGILGIGLTLPSTVILDVLPRFRQYKQVSWSWFGFQFQPLHDFECDTYFQFDNGVIISGTDRGSPARLAGIQTNDRLISCNGLPLTAINAEDIPKLNRKIALLPFEETATFIVERNGKLLTFNIKPRSKGSTEGKEKALPHWGISAKEINRFDNPTLFFYAPDGGVFVFGMEDSWLRRSVNNLCKDDIIVSIDDKPVKTLAELTEIYDNFVEHKDETPSMNFVIIRNGRKIHAVVNYIATDEAE